MMQKSFSHADNSYIQLFKHRKKLSPLIGDYKINNFFIRKKAKPKIFEIDKLPNSTNVKLDLIISELQKSNSYITKQFFEDNNLQSENEDLRKRMQQLYSKKKLKENKKNTEKKRKKYIINGIQDAIQHMIYITKKYAIDKELIRIKTEQNNKSPSICRYTPNLSYISKHIPAFYFGYNKTNKNKIKIINEKFKTTEKPSTKNRSVEEEKNNTTIKNTNLSHKKINFNHSHKDDKSIIENNIKNKLRNGNDTSEKIKTIKILKNIIKRPSKSIKNLQSGHLLDKIISKLEKNDKNDKNNSISIDKYTHNVRTQKIKKNIFQTYEPIKMKYNTSVPIFDKMTGREKKFSSNNKNMADYNPDYDVIYPKNYKYIFVSDRLKKKKYKLRKILGSYNTKGDYVLLPILNK